VWNDKPRMGDNPKPGGRDTAIKKPALWGKKKEKIRASGRVLQWGRAAEGGGGLWGGAEVQDVSKSLVENK